MIWATSAVIVALLLYQGGDKYFQDLDAVCAQRIAQVDGRAISFEQGHQWTAWETQHLARVDHPDGLEDERAEILGRKNRELEMMALMLQQMRSSSDPEGTFYRLLPQLHALVKDNNSRFAELGLDECTR